MSWSRAWAEALARLELDTDRAEQLLRLGRTPESADQDLPEAAWSPPRLGPIPEDMVERARRVLARQTEVSARLASAVAENRRHADLVSQSVSGPAARLPVFVDEQV